MKFGIVALSLGVILLAPIVVSPGSPLLAEEGLVGETTAQQVMSMQIATSAGDLPGQAVEAPSTNVSPRISSPASAPRGVPSPPVRQELEVSVSCGQDGCVVTNGLEVTVLESAR